jgi:hypothetical protein
LFWLWVGLKFAQIHYQGMQMLKGS